MGSDRVERDTPFSTPLTEALTVFALCGFAIAQPLFDLLGRNSTFFVVHGVGGVELVAFAIALVLIPPLVIVAVLALVRLLSRPVERWLFNVIAGALVAFVLVPALDRAFGFSEAVWLVGMAAITIAAAQLIARWPTVRRFATYLAPAPILFLVLFLFASPANALLADSDPSAVAGASTATTPVVMLVFDEFALGTLVDATGDLDRKRFPGIARLADMSTWYPNATTVATLTDRAVPAILSGLVPEDNAAPVAAAYPRSLFTMLGQSGPVRATEDVTDICPDSICRDRRTPSSSGFLSDTAVVFGHNVLPAGLETRWLPSIEGQWSGFGDEDADVPVLPDTSDQPSIRKFKEALHRKRDAQGGREDPVVLFDEFVESIRGPARSGLWYGHFHFPHSGYKRLPDGTLYMDTDVWPLQRTTLPRRTRLSGFQVMRYMLQVAYADRMVNQLLDRMEQQGMLDQAMVIVVSDHGQSFQQPRDLRAVNGLTEVNRDEVLPVPLFVKYPNESAGKVDRRVAETIDILPTVADALDARLPADWKFDGASLLAPPRPRERTVLFVHATPDLLADVRAERMGGWIRQQIVEENGDLSDLYRLGPFGGLVGLPVSVLGSVIPANGATATVDSAYAYRDVDPERGHLPAMMRANLTGVGDGYVAVALNGTIAGLGPTFLGNDGPEAVAILNPRHFRRGVNTVTLYRLSGDPASPRVKAIAADF